LSIGLAVIPESKFLEGGKILGRALFDGLLDVIGRAASWGRFGKVVQQSIGLAVRLGERPLARLGDFLFSNVQHALSKLPAIFGRIFGVGVRVARVALSGLRGVAGEIFGQVEKTGERAFKSIGGSIVRAVGKIVVFGLKVDAINYALSTVAGWFDA